MATHNILVIGAAGKSGTPIVEQGVARGHRLTAFVRHPSKAAHLPKTATIVEGDGLDAGAVAAAVAMTWSSLRWAMRAPWCPVR